MGEATKLLSVQEQYQAVEKSLEKAKNAILPRLRENLELRHKLYVRELEKLNLKTSDTPWKDYWGYRVDFKVLSVGEFHEQFQISYSEYYYDGDTYYAKLNLKDPKEKIIKRAKAYAAKQLRYANYMTQTRRQPREKYFYKKPKAKPMNKERFVNRLANRLKPARIELLCLLIEADHSGRPPLPKCMPESAKEILELSKRLGVDKDEPEAILKGRHLIARGMTPSKEFGDILKKAYEMQLDGRFNSVEQALELLEI
jgi:hypothetical protein